MVRGGESGTRAFRPLVGTARRAVCGGFGETALPEGKTLKEENSWSEAPFKITREQAILNHVNLVNHVSHPFQLNPGS